MVIVILHNNYTQRAYSSKTRIKTGIRVAVVSLTLLNLKEHIPIKQGLRLRIKFA